MTKARRGASDRRVEQDSASVEHQRSSRSGPLAGLRVLDVGTMIAGPVAATLLGDFGAEVVKVEQPGTGDPMRQIGPFANEESLWWNVEGRSKRSITVDLRKAEGQVLFRRLAEHADVVVENFRPGTMARWGLGYDELKAVNPRLVMLSVSGYGQTGPYASRAAYDRIALAFGGLLNITGFPDRAPVRPGTAVADYQAALFGAFAVMLALYHRDAGDGPGQHIDVSLYESIFRFTDILVTAYDKLGIRRERRGNTHFAAAPGDHFKTSDGRYIVLTVSSNGMFTKLCAAMERPALANDPRFSTHDARWKNIDEINGIVGAWIRAIPVPALCETLDRNGLAYSLVYSVEDIVADPHYAARGSIVSVDNERTGPLKMQGVLPRLCGTPPPAIRPAPTLGADTEAILRELLGLTDDGIADLRRSGAI